MSPAMPKRIDVEISVAARLLTTVEVAELLAVSERTVRRLVAAGEIRPVRLGTCVRFHPAELARLTGAPLTVASQVDAGDASARADRDASAGSARDVAAAGPQVEEPISDGQLRAFHAKVNDLDRRTHAKAGATKTAILEWLGEQLGREVESSRELTAREANLVLDQLECWRDEAIADGGVV